MYYSTTADHLAWIIYLLFRWDIIMGVFHQCYIAARRFYLDEGQYSWNINTFLALLWNWIPYEYVLIFYTKYLLVAPNFMSLNNRSLSALDDLLYARKRLEKETLQGINRPHFPQLLHSLKTKDKVSHLFGVGYISNMADAFSAVSAPTWSKCFPNVSFTVIAYRLIDILNVIELSLII